MHIYTEKTFPICNDYIGFASPIYPPAPGNNQNEAFEKAIEINFTPKTDYAYLDVKPNPSNGIFTIQLTTNKKNDVRMEVQVFDFIGNVVYFSKTGINATLDLTHLAKGIYYLQVKNQFNSFIQKIIIN